MSPSSILCRDDVTGNVTVSLRDVPWDQCILGDPLRPKGLMSQQFGNIVRVAPIETVKSEQQAALEAQQAKEKLTPLQILIIPLNYAEPQSGCADSDATLRAWNGRGGYPFQSGHH